MSKLSESASGVHVAKMADYKYDRMCPLVGGLLFILILQGRRVPFNFISRFCFCSSLDSFRPSVAIWTIDTFLLLPVVFIVNPVQPNFYRRIRR